MTGSDVDGVVIPDGHDAGLNPSVVR